MDIIDISIIVVYILLTLFVGIWVSKKASNRVNFTTQNCLIVIIFYSACILRFNF